MSPTVYLLSITSNKNDVQSQRITSLKLFLLQRGFIGSSEQLFSSRVIGYFIVSVEYLTVHDRHRLSFNSK